MHGKGEEPHDGVDEWVDEEEAELTVDAGALAVHVVVVVVGGRGGPEWEDGREGSGVLVVELGLGLGGLGGDGGRSTSRGGGVWALGCDSVAMSWRGGLMNGVA